MKNALISPNEKVYDYQGNYLGERVAEVADNQFPVAPPLFWLECNDNVNSSDYYYNEVLNDIELKPIQPSDAPENIVDVTQTVS